MKNFVRFLKEIRSLWRSMLLAVFLTLCTAAFSPWPPIIIKYLTDTLSTEGLRKNLPVNLGMVFVATVLLAIGSALFGFGLQFTLTKLSQEFKSRMRRKLYTHIQSLSLGFFEKASIGKLMSNITQDVAALDRLIAGSFVTVVQDIATLLGVVGYLLILNWKLALICLTVYPIYILNYLIFIKYIKHASHQVRDQRDEVYGDMQEKLAGVQVVKSYARERHEVAQFVGETRRLFGYNVRLDTLSTALWTIAEMIGAIGTALLIWYGGMAVIRGEMTVGSLIAFYGFISGYLYGPTLRLIQIQDQLARTNAALWRIFKTLDTAPTVNDLPDAKPMPPIRGDVEYDSIWFEYEPDVPVIKNVSLRVKAGEMVAFVGPSGSGKTTLVNLLQRHYDVKEGAIRIDGNDIRDVTLETIRRQIGVVIQETILFNTTLRENIRYGKLDATDAEVEDAARAANIAHVIETLPDGYETRIGEDGIKLSAGEKQRVAIARALLADPRILILDEATSSLDSETESLIQEAMDRLMINRTSFVIAHRLSTIVRADKIIVMERGEIREMGTHAELLEYGGLYAGLYLQQFDVALREEEAKALPIHQPILALS